MYEPMFYGNHYIVTMNEKMVVSEFDKASKSKAVVQSRCNELNSFKTIITDTEALRVK